MGIASSIKKKTVDGADVVDIRRPVEPRRKVSLSVPQLLAAGIALMFVSAGSVWLALSGNETGIAPTVAEVPLLGESAALLASFDHPGYDAAVASLERVLEAGRGQLDPATVAVLEQSLATIDQAIAEARVAINSDPTNYYLS